MGLRTHRAKNRVFDRAKGLRAAGAETRRAKLLSSINCLDGVAFADTLSSKFQVPGSKLKTATQKGPFTWNLQRGTWNFIFRGRGR